MGGGRKTVRGADGVSGHPREGVGSSRTKEAWEEGQARGDDAAPRGRAWAGEGARQGVGCTVDSQKQTGPGRDKAQPSGLEMGIWGGVEVKIWSGEGTEGISLSPRV